MGNVPPEGVNNSLDLPPSVSDYVTPQYSPIKKSQGLPAKKPVNGEDAGIAPRPPVNKRTKAIFCPQVSRGLQNVGNSCYGNAVIQALFSTPLFPQDIIQLASSHVPPSSTSSITSLSSSTSSSTLDANAPPSISDQTRQQPPLDPPIITLPVGQHGVPQIDLKSILTIPEQTSILPEFLKLFYDLETSRVGTIISPLSFFVKLRDINSLFRSLVHQDSHEFLIFLLNNIVESLDPKQATHLHSSASFIKNEGVHPNPIQKFFQGQLSYETQCVACESVSSVDETFLNLSLDIVPNVSISHCLRQFFAPELLSGQNKFFCTRCAHLQEAIKRLRLKQAPENLIIHLKRFKFTDKLQRLGKLSHRVYFGSELRLDDAPEHLYHLYAVVVHLGHGPNTGHYVSIVKQRGSAPVWVLFDDHSAKPFKFDQMETIFGSALSNQSSSCGYLLFYSKTIL